MQLLSWNPATAVFWGGLAVMLWASWTCRFRPDVVLRLAAMQSGSIGDQAERWLQERPHSH